MRPDGTVLDRPDLMIDFAPVVHVPNTIPDAGATEPPPSVHDLDDRRLLRTRVLGGVINEHRCAA